MYLCTSVITFILRHSELLSLNVFTPNGQTHPCHFFFFFLLITNEWRSASFPRCFFTTYFWPTLKNLSRNLCYRPHRDPRRVYIVFSDKGPYIYDTFRRVHAPTWYVLKMTFVNFVLSTTIVVAKSMLVVSFFFRTRKLLASQCECFLFFKLHLVLFYFLTKQKWSDIFK